MKQFLFEMMAIAMLAVVVAGGVVAAARPVGAEDDCKMDTWNVVRLPVVGLVCIGEPL